MDALIASTMAVDELELEEEDPKISFCCCFSTAGLMCFISFASSSWFSYCSFPLVVDGALVVSIVVVVVVGAFLFFLLVGSLGMMVGSLGISLKGDLGVMVGLGGSLRHSLRDATIFSTAP